jgi:hypothetical protein
MAHNDSATPRQTSKVISLACTEAKRRPRESNWLAAEIRCRTVDSTKGSRGGLGGDLERAPHGDYWGCSAEA